MMAFWLAAVQRSSGSVAFCMALHGVLNTLSSLLAMAYGHIYIVGSLALTVLAIVVGMKFPANSERKLFS